MPPGETQIVDEYRHEDARHTIVASVWEMAQAAARRVEEKYGVEELGPWDDFDWGILNGQMSALRWMLGEDWDLYARCLVT
jgi:hypothetical protein